MIREEGSMEESVKEQPFVGDAGNTTRPKFQKHPLRSSIKPKEDLCHSAAPKRGRPISSVSKSVGVLDLSSKEKSAVSAKPPRRLSIPTKQSATPGPKFSPTVAPISETRTRRSANSQGRNETPSSDINRPSSRKKFNTLTSVSFWSSQIKASEAAGKHPISLGFFKLALEAGVQPLQRMQDELKSYARRYRLAELGEPVKELFESYNISENTDQLQVSESISQVPEEGAQSSDAQLSDGDVQSSSPTMATGKLKTKCLNIDSTQPTPATESTKKGTTDSTQPTPVTESTKKETVQKNNPGKRKETIQKNNPGMRKETIQKNNPGTRVRGNISKNSANSRPGLDSGSRKLVKKYDKPSKEEPSQEKGKIRKQAPVRALPAQDELQENKENKDAEEISLTEVM